MAALADRDARITELEQREKIRQDLLAYQHEKRAESEAERAAALTALRRIGESHALGYLQKLQRARKVYGGDGEGVWTPDESQLAEAIAALAAVERKQEVSEPEPKHDGRPPSSGSLTSGAAVERTQE